MHFVIEIGAVIGNDDHHRNFEVRGCPKGVYSHEVVAIADHTDSQATTVLQRQGRADRVSGTGTDRAAAVISQKR